MASYGTTEETDPMITERVTHPLPGKGGWGERDRWIGARSSRVLRRPFLDPVLYQIDDEPEDIGVDQKYNYLQETGLRFKGFFTSKLPEFHLHTLFIYSLLIVAVLMDGVRPIVLVYSKAGLPKYPYMFAVWVVLVKLIVVFFSLTMWYGAWRRGETQSNLSFSKKCFLSLYFVVPVVSYVASDVLNFVLFEHHISATMFACVKQSRIVFTAIMFRTILGRNVSPIQWIAVFQLCLASILFVSDDTGKSEEVVDFADELIGLNYLIIKCVIDSIAVIWMDKYFKVLDEAGFPYWEQQVAFAIFSLISGILFVGVYNYDELTSGRGWFDGFNGAAWLSAGLTGFYGILVSLVLRYLDSMVKQFQALASIVVTTILDQVVFGKQISLTSWVAIQVILISVFLYKLGATKHKV